MTFANLWILGAGVVVALAAVIGLHRYTDRRRRLAEFLGGRRAAERLGRSRLQRVPLGRMVLLAAAALLLGAAGAGPRWGDRGTPPPPPEAPPPTVMVAIDISASMQAEDVSPTRLARAAEVARELLGTLEGSRVGLALFSGTPYVLAPPTEDHRVLEYLLDGITPELLNIYDPGSLPSALLREATATLAEEGTRPEVRSDSADASAGDPVESGGGASSSAEGTDALGGAAPGQPRAPGPRFLVVIGDGEAGEPLNAVREAAAAATEEGIRIHTVGVGTPEGGRLVLPAGYTRKGVDGSGPSGPMVSSLEEETLRMMAEEGGGTYVHAGDAAGLARMYRALGPAGDAPQPDAEGPFWTNLDPATLLIAAALLALLAESLWGMRLGRGRSWRPGAELRVGRAP